VCAPVPNAHVCGSNGLPFPKTNAHVRNGPEIGQKVFPAEKYARARTRACSLTPMLGRQGDGEGRLPHVRKNLRASAEKAPEESSKSE